MLFLSSPESVVPKDHPIRAVKKFADQVLKEMSSTFDAMYAEGGRDSVPPERLLKAMLLMALYSVRSERLFCEQLGYNLLFRWFLDMTMTEAPFNASTFSKNRERLMKHDAGREFFGRVVQMAQAKKLASHEHFTVDGSLIEAWASMKSFKSKEDDDKKGPDDDDRGNPSVDFHGEKRSNETHESTTDPEAKLMRRGRGKEAKLSFGALAVTENRNGLLVEMRIGDARTPEPVTAIAIFKDHSTNVHATVAGDKGFDTRGFVEGCRELNITPHVAQRTHSAIDARTTRHAGYLRSQRFRKRIEEVFGWMKTVGNFRKTRWKGIARTQFAAYLVGAAYNLVRVVKLLKVAPAT